MLRDPDPTDGALADLADLILSVGRLVRARTPEGAHLVALTETERQVMRLVGQHPGVSPSEIARSARLQRTNVSTALRGLEEKKMVTRTATQGRGVAVLPTELAAANLRSLRASWTRQMAGVLGDDAEAVRQCTDLLIRLERGLTADG